MHPPLKLRHVYLLVAATLVCIVVVEVFGPAEWRRDEYVHVVVDRGMTFSQIAQRFKASGLIKEELLFKVLGRVFRIEHRAKAGRYRFKSNVSMYAILRTLYKGATYRESILVSPGKTLEQVARLLRQAAAVDSAAFVADGRDSLFLAGLGLPGPSANGYLMPDTYEIEWREEPGSVMARMVANFFRVFDDSLKARAHRIGMTMREVVTLASIIEKEAYLDAERPRISAVFHNRLKIGMKLQADPTVRYALGKWTGRLLYSDLKIPSPYNTYFTSGLPPDPICSPREASILAALYPVPGSRETYFVAVGDGSHHFSSTVGEHNLAKQRWKEYLRTVEAARDSLSRLRADSLRADSLRAEGLRCPAADSLPSAFSDSAPSSAQRAGPR